MKNKCLWCQGKNIKSFCNKGKIDEAIKCNDCGIVHMKNMPDKVVLFNKYKEYESKVHKSCDDILRKKMYKIEYDIVRKFLHKKSCILDVGCSSGGFLEFFQVDNHNCHGVEIGKEAYDKLSNKVHIESYYGEFPKIDIKKKFDLIIFRGTIEHFLNPRDYLDKAVSLLKKNGLIFITSTPNVDALCFELFKEKWNQFHPYFHLYHFSEENFDKYFKDNNMCKIHRSFPYLETPYADEKKDLEIVKKAISCLRNNSNIDFESPAFYGNMMSLIYKRND